MSSKKVTEQLEKTNYQTQHLQIYMILIKKINILQDIKKIIIHKYYYVKVIFISKKIYNPVKIFKNIYFCFKFYDC